MKTIRFSALTLCVLAGFASGTIVYALEELRSNGNESRLLAQGSQTQNPPAHVLLLGHGRVEFEEMRIGDLMTWLGFVTGVQIEVRDGNDIQVSGAFDHPPLADVLRETLYPHRLGFRYDPNEDRMLVMSRGRGDARQSEGR